MTKLEPGWALMEFIAHCRVPLLDSVEPIVEVCAHHQFSLDAGGLLAQGADLEDFIGVPSGMSVRDVVEYLRESATRVFVRLSGRLADKAARVSAMLDLGNAVVVMSVKENVVFGFSDEMVAARFDCFRAFAWMCRDVAELSKADSVTICSEQYSSIDFRDGGAQRFGMEPYRPELFSDANLRTVFSDYVDYLRRPVYKRES